MISEPELRETLVRQAESYDVPPHDLMSLRAAALRRRQKLRLWSGGGIAAAVLLAAGITVGLLRPDQGDVHPVDRGLPEVSDPAQVLAKYGRVHVGWVLVYADGRVLSKSDLGPIYERRLTSSAVAAVRAGSLGPYDLLNACGRHTSPACGSTLPEDVWVDSDAHKYRPTAYAVCLFAGPNQSGDLRVFPAAVRDILRGAPPAQVGHVVPESRELPGPSGWHCLRVDSAERADLLALDGTAARVDGEDIVFAGSPGAGIWASVQPILPHGRWIAWGG